MDLDPTSCAGGAMPDNLNLPNVNESAIIDKVTACVYQAILDIQQQQPELLTQKYRKINWQDTKNQSIFLDKLQAELSGVQEEKVLFSKLRKFLQFLLEESFFKTAECKSLIDKIRQIIQPGTLSPSQTTTQQIFDRTSIAILLLDAENLQLDVETEKFLASICTYPIQIKVAFANWRSMGKQDLEFHGRGYELIHVPQGKDSADFKMATVGSSIFVHYPTAKEVLVCSSDNGLTHLGNTLQTHGLTVYRVRKQEDNITVLNSKTGEIKTRSLKTVPQIPSVAESIAQLKAVIKAEQKRTGYHWIKLSRLSNLFQAKHSLTLSEVLAIHFPDKKVKDFFNDYPADFVVHQLPDRSQVYVTLFDIPQQNKAEGESEPQTSNGKDIQATEIKSLEELEQVLIALFKELTITSPENPISLEVIGTEFQKQYGQPINNLIKDNLKLNGNLLKILQSFSSFNLEQKKGKWLVAIAPALRNNIAQN